MDIYKGLFYLKANNIIEADITNIFKKFRDYYQQFRITNPIKMKYHFQNHIFLRIQQILADKQV